MKKPAMLLALALAFQTSAQDFSEPAFLNAADVLEAAATVTAEDYPNADTVLVDNLVHEAYRDDGTAVSWDDEYLKILTEKGRQSAGVRRVWIAAAYNTAAVERATIYKPDGRVVDVDVAAQSRVMVDPGQMQSNIYDPNRKILQLTIPGLEVGDTLYTLTKRVTFKTRVPDFWGDYQVFESTDPLRRLVYEVSMPAGLPLKHKMLRDEVAGTVTHTEEKLDEGRTLLRWEVRDVPRMFAEPKMPPLHTVTQRLLVSTAEDWPSLSRWYWNLCEPRLAATTEEMTNTVARLIADAETDMDKVRALFKFVSQEIRYMGITTEEEAPGYEPHDVSMTFDNKYGVCRDKAALLATMLRIAGVEGFPVLIHAGARMDPDVPVPYFNHAITAAKINGEYVLMDPTDESTKDLLPSYLCRKSYLIAHPVGETLLLSPVNPADENLVSITTTGKADENGTLTLDTTLDFGGINDNVYRGHFLRNKPADRKKLFEAILKASLPGAEVLSFTLEPADLQDTSVPLKISVSARALDWPMRGEDDMAAVNLPWLGRHVGYVNWLLGTTGLDERKYPYETDIACGVRETIILDAGAVFTGQAGAMQPLKVESPELRFTLDAGMEGDTLTGAYVYEMRETVFSPEQYQALRVTLQDIEAALKQRPLFHARQDAEADIRILDTSTVIELESPRAWTTTRETTLQVLTYAGMKRNSELSISYNPVWQTAEIVEAVVSNKNGAVFSITPKELNEMDAGWVASAPDYPAAKTLVASLPGVEVGSVIRTVVKTTQKDAPFFSHTQTFGGFEPTDAATLEVRPAPGMSLNKQEWTNNGTFDKTQTSWSCVNLPALRREDGLPGLRMLLPTVVLSSQQDWKAYSKTLQSSIEPLVNPSKQIREHARKITTPFKAREDKIKALRDDVLKNIRQAGPSFTELPLNTLSTPDKTLARGYGHALDRMILLDAMLRAEGFKTEIIFMENRRTPPGEMFHSFHGTPQRGEFTHPLIAVLPERSLWNKIFGSVDAYDILYVGDGDQYTPLGATAYDRFYALNPASSQINRTWVKSEFQAQSKSETTIDLQPNGDAIITHTNWHYGAACAAFRKHYIEQPPEERRREHLELINGFSRGAEPLSPLVTETEAYPGFTAFSLRAPRYAAVGGDTMTVLLPPPSTLPLSLQSDRRYNPLLAPKINSDQKTVRVILPKGFDKRVAAPSSMDTNLGVAHLTQETREADRKALRFDSSTRMSDRLFASDEYPMLLEINRKLAHPSQRTLILMKGE
ncbi:MAG: DUF3857 domain-containing protein [Kiritimatiellaeota bacterium]|nr:DUF3857 domain-containing protein [Kiritimatiellota bacterium]